MNGRLGEDKNEWEMGSDVDWESKNCRVKIAGCRLALDVLIIEKNDCTRTK